uniref:heavy metal translocating P-type ATPase n=1 Tax=Anaerococcus mediterraneensis TaxID=1870984 RepID=UPI000931FF9C|nr:heavy metal translocating P-type ATPase [Anaerococcus mediterraneensis]
MRASIAHRLDQRARFVYEENLPNEMANNLKYLIEKIDGVRMCKVNTLASSFTVYFDQGSMARIARNILDLDIKEVKDLVIEDPDFYPQPEEDIFHIVRDALYRRMFFKYMIPPFLGPYFIVARAYPFVKAGIKAIKNRKINVELLDATAISVSLLTGEFGDAANIMFLLDLGEKLEDYTLKRSKEDLAHSLALNIDKVFVMENGEKILKSLKDVEVGELVVVEMGSSIPVDGKVVDGLAVVNESSFTGESEPVKKVKGSVVFAGTVLEEGSLLIETSKKYDDSRLSHIINLLGQNEKNKSLAQKNAENMADSLVKYSFMGAGLTYLLTRNFIKAKSFLMVDFSCALKLTIPIAIMKAISQASEMDVIVKGGKFLENLAKADTIVFDKTGTLTKSEPDLAKVISFTDISEDECLRIAACLEEHFPHSIARAVVKKARDKKLNHEEMHSKPEYIVAHGIKSTIAGSTALIGSEHFVLEDEGIEISQEVRDKIDSLKENYSLLYLALSGRLIAALCIEDPIREEAANIISELRKLGINDIAMLTGDAENAARSVAETLGIDYYKSQVLPEDKENFIKEKKAAGKTVIMVGDGINDSVALSRSDVGISMHQGADIAKEIADITIGTDSLDGLVDLIKLSKALDRRLSDAYKKIVSINSTLIILGVLGRISNTNSSLIHNLSTLMIAANNMNNYKI